jgi:CBS domain-containing protein
LCLANVLGRATTTYFIYREAVSHGKGTQLDLDLKAKMVVREAMSSPVVAISEDRSVVDAAKVMSEHRIGSVIVNDAEGHLVGIVTERDLVFRVIAENRVPREIRVSEVMSSPLRTVDPETSLEEAMKMMDRLNIRRLGVTYKGRLEGVITDKDILRVMPALIEIVRERSRIQASSIPVGPSLLGYCDRCNMYSSNLRNVDGELLCEDCRAED